MIDSDESDEEMEVERRALSPSTRRSIGVFVAESSDSENEIEEEEESQDGEPEATQDYNNETSSATNDQDLSHNSVEDDTETHQTLYKPRESEFETSIQQKISSTMAPINEDDSEATIADDSALDDSVQEVLKMSSEVLEISSSLDESEIPSPPVASAGLQPKIKNLLVKVSFLNELSLAWLEFASI